MQRSIINYLTESVNKFMNKKQQEKIKQQILNTIKNKKTVNTILSKMNKEARKQAEGFPRYNKRNGFFLYPFEKELDDGKYYRISGFIEIDNSHASDVVCFYYPSNKKYEIELDGVNG